MKTQINCAEKTVGLMARLRRSAAFFTQSEDGGITHIAVATAIMMIAFGGLGIDMIHAELKRAKIQATLDRSVLAAAELSNDLPPEAVVRDYFAKMQLTSALDDVQVVNTGTRKRVSAQTSSSLNANFSQIFGVDRFDVTGSATAEQIAETVEIAMVLDISGSMAENARMQNMRSAAEVFVETVLEADRGNMSISVVPYAEQVNLGDRLFNYLGVNEIHPYSRCVEMENNAYDTTNVWRNGTYTQSMQFQFFAANGGPLEYKICPDNDYEEILAFSNDENELTSMISQLQPRTQTAIHVGMKWGVAMLDPSMRGYANSLINTGDASTVLRGIPMNYGLEDSKKHILLMTDGENVPGWRLDNDLYDTAAEREAWQTVSLSDYLTANVPDQYAWGDYYHQFYSRQLADALLDDICDAAKARDIIIWAVAFEAPTSGQNVLRQCASSDLHYFNASGTDLSDVFYSIARSITQLRLTE